MPLSPYLIAIVSSWIIAQSIKFLIANNKGPVDYRNLYVSGSMPSAHSASAVALLTVVGIEDGVDGALFATVALLAGIVMYDAVMVRRSSGEQGGAIQALIRELKSTIRLPKSAKGHEPLEVVVGAFIGLVVGLTITFLVR